MSGIGIEISIKGDQLPNYEGILDRFVLQSAHKIRSRMREKLAESKHGRLYRRRGGEGFSRAHRASRRGEAPASDSGALSRSLNVIHPATMTAAIETNLDYPGILESKMNRPLWAASVDELLPVLENDLYQMMS